MESEKVPGPVVVVEGGICRDKPRERKSGRRDGLGLGVTGRA